LRGILQLNARSFKRNAPHGNRILRMFGAMHKPLRLFNERWLRDNGHLSLPSGLDFVAASL
jgi:hypothetical protein